jgi:hypothetical protein
MSAATRYVEHPLHPGLAGIVEAAWSVRLDAGGPAVEHEPIRDVGDGIRLASVRGRAGRRDRGGHREPPHLT